MTAQRDLILDTPQGLVSPNGVHFHTTRALLEDFAGPVLEVVSLPTLVERAEVWLRSGAAIALWMLAGLLLAVPPLWAGLGALFVYVFWEVLSPLWVSRRFVGLLRGLENPIVQAVLFVAVLSALGVRGQVTAVGLGLAGFVLVRWGIVPRLLRPVLRLLRRPLYTLPAADQVLRAFVLRAALRHGVTLPQLEALKKDLRT